MQRSSATRHLLLWNAAKERQVSVGHNSLLAWVHRGTPMNRSDVPATEQSSDLPSAPSETNKEAVAPVSANGNNVESS